MLRIATKDYKRVMHKKELMMRCKRVTPSEWAQYTTSFEQSIQSRLPFFKN